MINRSNNPNDTEKMEDLKNQISALQQELEDARTVNQAMWSLLVEITKRIQASSASIKAAVSSLLGYDILWDGTTQHEFLETIDKSVDQLSNQVMLLSLAFRFESKKLEIKREPHLIQEVLSQALDVVSSNHPELILNTEVPLDGELVFVDYEYLLVAFRLLFEAFAQTQAQDEKLNVILRKTEEAWIIGIYGISNLIFESLEKLPKSRSEELMQDISLLPIQRLILLNVCKIFDLQDIKIETVLDVNRLFGLQINVPFVHL